MRSKPSARLFALSLLVTVMTVWPRLAAAQSDADRAAAQALFEEGQELKEAGELAQACAKFQGSQKLDPAVGTQLNLADCYEQTGKTASAWVNFTEVADNPATDSRRAEFARKRAAALKPKLVRLVLDVQAPVAGMILRRGDREVPRETWGTPIPVDPGRYEIVASAKGHSAWRETVELSAEGEVIEVTVPSLVERESPNFEDDVPATEPVEESEGSGQTIAGGVLIALGAGGVVVGGVLAGLAHQKAAESEDHCLPEDPNRCQQAGVDLREQAQAQQVGYAISFAAGGALLVAGLVTLLTAPSEAAEPEDDGFAGVAITPWLAPTSSGLSLSGRF